MWVFVSTVVEHLNAILVAGGALKPVIQLNKYREIVAIIFTVTILPMMLNTCSIEMKVVQQFEYPITYRIDFEPPSQTMNFHRF